MKIYWFILFIAFIFTGCVPGKSSLAININKKINASVSSASVSSVQIINNKLIINGLSLASISNVLVSGHSLNENFSIESQTATKIIASSIHGFSFDISKVFDLILSDASASTTFQIDFSLCKATLNGAAFDCDAAIADNDVLTYDLDSNTWIPRPLSGLRYKGVWNANTTAPYSNQSGQYYIVSVANLPTYKVGDWIVWNGSSYDIVAQSGGGAGVSTVFGRPGAVVAAEGDYNLDQLLDVDLSAGANPGQVLKFIGGAWIAADDDVGSVVGAGSITSTELANSSVTDAKIVGMATSKLTGTINSAQITDATIVNADIAAGAAIDYSKLNIPAGSIPYDRLIIVDGGIPAVKISGLPSAAAILSTSITNGDLTHAPDGNVVFNTLATKLDKTGGTITTMLNVPEPVLDTEATTKKYVDDIDNLKANKGGDTFSGVLTLDDDLKIKGGTNYVTIKGHATSAAYNLVLPVDAGTNNQVLTTNGLGALSWTTPSSGAVTLTGDVSGTSGATTIGTGKVTSTHILDGTILNADINAAAAIDYSKLNVPAAAIPLTALNATGTKDATKYLKGDNTWATLTTDVLGTALSGLTLTNAAITASDTVISAFGKLQKQVTDFSGATMGGDLTGTLPSPTVAKIKGVTVSATAPTDGQFFKYTSTGTNWLPSFVTATDLKSTALGNLFPGSGCASNQTLYYSVVGDSFSCANIDTLDAGKITTGTIAAGRLPASASYWGAATGGINYAGGKVGIGTASPVMPLHIHTAAGADPNILFTDGDLSHPFSVFSSVIPTTASGYIGNINGTGGGLGLTGVTSNATTNGVGLIAYLGSTAPTASAFYLQATKSNGSGNIAALGSNETVLNVTNAGTSVLRVMGSGNVGIGTTSPGSALDVAGKITADEFLLKGSMYSFGWDDNVYSSSSSSLGTPDGPSISITNAHNMDGAVSLFTGASRNAADTTQTFYMGSVSNTTGYAPTIVFGQRTGNTAYTERMRISASGNVGIGNDNPTKALSVNGEIEALTVTANSLAGATVNAGILNVQSANAGWVIGAFGNTANDGYSGFAMTNNVGAIKGFMGYSNVGASALPGSLFYTSEGTGVPLILGTNRTERMRITDTGVGINGVNGAYNFYVNGTVAGTSAYVNASDRRLKKNITLIPDALDKITKLRGVTYNWNHDVHPELVLSHREEMGVIAQEVEKVFPDAVSDDKTSGIKSVAYTMLIAPLIEAVKMLNKMVTDLFSTTQNNTREIASVKSELSNKDQEIKKLQRENAEMKARLDRMEKMLMKK